MRRLLVLVFGAVLLGGVGAQVKSVPTHKDGKPLATVRPDPAEALVRQLGSTDFKLRSAATKSLRKLGEQARPALERGLSASNLEQRMRSRSLLDELDARAPEGAAGADAGRLRPLPQGRAGPGGGARREMEESLRAFERVMEDLRRGRSPRARFDPFRDLRLSFPDLRSGSGAGWRSTSMLWKGETLELEHKPDGSVVFKVKDAQGKSRSYEATSLEDFQQQHGKIFKKYRGSGLLTQPSGSVSFTIDGLLGGRRSLARRSSAGREDAVSPLLGLTVGQVPQALRAHVDMPREAILVTRVLPGASGQALGLKRWDVLLAVDGLAVASSAAIRRALKRSPHPALLILKVLRKGQVRTLQGPWPGAGPKLPKKSGK